MDDQHERIGRFAYLGLGLCLLLLLLLVLGAGLIWSHMHSRDGVEWVRHTEQVKLNISSFLSIMQDSETGQRGFLLTGEDDYLEPYHTARKLLEQNLQDLRHATRDNPRQQESLVALGSQIELKLNELQRTIAVRRDEGLEAALKVVRTDEGKRAMDAIRELVQEMNAEEQRLLVLRNDRVARSSLITTAIMGTDIAMILVTAILVIIAINRDLKVRNQAEYKLKSVNADLRRMSKVFLDGSDPILLEDLEGRVIDMNAEAERTYGWSCEELVGQPIKTVVPAERHQQMDELSERCRGGEDVRNVEGLQCNKSGEVIPVLLTLSLLTVEAGEAVVIATMAKDISELKEAEANSLRDARLATIGKLVATVSHELRNPLSAIGNAVYYLKRRVPDTEPKWREYLGIIGSEAETSVQIISNLLEGTRAKKPAPRELNLGHKVDQIFVRQGIPDGVQWQFSCDPDPFIVFADEVQLQQVLTNLLANALQSMEAGGALSVTASRVANGDIIVFRDDGPGIAAQHRGSIFEPLFSTKAKGTGLGLWVSKRIIEQHGGSLELMNEPKSGAAFRIRLPRLDPTSQVCDRPLPSRDGQSAEYAPNR